MITSSELIESFYNTFKDKYPNISYEEMKKICPAQFHMLKEVMSEGGLEEVRLQYLFVARVSVSRVIKHLTDIYKKKAEDKISEKDFNKYNSLLLNHINNNPKKFKKYESRIRQITGRELTNI